MEMIWDLLTSGFGNVASYLAAHVLLCLLPAFLIAGAMTALIPKEIVTRFLGRDRPGVVSYPASAAAGFLLAVCSCTVIPLFAGIYKKGAGLGPAITFLFVAPAVNIMALSYTGKMLGMDLAIARLVLSITFGIGIGVIMARMFRKDDVEHDETTNAMFSGQAEMRTATKIFLALLVVLLVVGTIRIPLLQHPLFQWALPLTWAGRFQEFLHRLVPFDSSKGEEGVSLQGAFLISMLGLLGLTAWKGIERIHEGFNAWTWVSIGLVGGTLVFASLNIELQPARMLLIVNGKLIGVAILVGLMGWVLKAKLTEDEARDFLWESWRFVKQIFPLLVVGVFAVGVIRELIQPEWIQSLAGTNSILANLTAVGFGVFMYFPTLIEVPIANMFLDLGMHRGPLLAYLISDPELSLQSVLVTTSIIGRKKTRCYIGFVALFSTLAGFIYGAWINGL